MKLGVLALALVPGAFGLFLSQKPALAQFPTQQFPKSDPNAPRGRPASQPPEPRGQPARPPQVTCFKTGEEMATQNKICYYDCLGSRAAITIKAVELCPLSIKQ